MILADAGALPGDNATAVLATLNNALSSLANDRPNTITLLNAVITQVEGFMHGSAGTGLSDAQAQALIDAVQSIIDQLNG